MYNYTMQNILRCSHMINTFKKMNVSKRNNLFMIVMRKQTGEKKWEKKHY